MARPIAYDKEKVIDQTMHLFWEKGYESVSVEDIMVHSNFNRTSFYKLFKNKDGAYDTALEHYISQGRCEMQKKLAGKKGLQVIRDIITYTVEKYENSNGCLILNTLNADIDMDKKAYQRAQAQAESFEQFIQSVIKQAQTLGEIPTQKDAKLLGTILATTIFGVRFKLKNGADREEQRKVLLALLKEITS